MQLHVYCKDDLEVCIDERRMEQVMLNLLHNAYQHSPENTSIRYVYSWKQILLQ